MKSILNLATELAAREMGINPALAHQIYKSYWKFIRESIEKLELDTMSEEDFQNTTTNFSIPYIGKLYTNYEKTEKYRKKVKYLENHVKVKRNKTTVQSGVSD